MGNSLLDPFSERTRANTRNGFWKPIENKSITDVFAQRRYGRVHREYGISSAHVRIAFTGGSGAIQRAYGDVFTAGTGNWAHVGAFLQCRYGSFSSQVRRDLLGCSEDKTDVCLASRAEEAPSFLALRITPGQGGINSDTFFFLTVRDAV
jgi:hypothetical protein